MTTIELLSLKDPVFTTIILFFVIVVILLIYVTQKLHYISRLRKNMEIQDQTISELDQQAKLIIKSDMELKLYQQEIEDKLTKLTLIKELIINSMHTLSKKELFAQINENIVHAMGFKNALLFNFSDLSIISEIGFGRKETNEVISLIKYKKEALKGVNFLSSSSELMQQIAVILQTKQTFLAPIKVMENIYAVLIVSHPIIAKELKKPDEEAFLIICMHLCQCLDKIRLFEGLYHTKDDLERKIKERTNELVKSLRAIEVISKAKSDFISAVSHELRTPLTSVKGFSSLLVEEKFGKLPGEAKKRLITIDDNVNKLMTIVNTLLDIARIESGKMEIKIVPAEAVKLINDVTGFLTPQVTEKNISLSVKTPPSLNVYMDKALIERVLLNLIGNAIKFTPTGGKIAVGLTQTENQAVVSVQDTGCGMKQDDLGKIFQEFYRVSNIENTKIRGTGLGLSLVKRIIDTHKEKIWVKSSEGKGTIFYFTLKVFKNA
jgi:signal transduction histidine kinase